MLLREISVFGTTAFIWWQIIYFIDLQFNLEVMLSLLRLIFLTISSIVQRAWINKITFSLPRTLDLWVKLSCLQEEVEDISKAVFSVCHKRKICSHWLNYTCMSKNVFTPLCIGHLSARNPGETAAFKMLYHMWKSFCNILVIVCLRNVRWL